MSGSKKNDSLAEFRGAVLKAYEALLRDHGFVEIPRRPGAFVNEYSVRLSDGVVTVEVEGIHWGAAAWTKLYKASEADDDNYGLPVGRLLQSRTPESGKPRKRGVMPSQAEQVVAQLDRLRALAPDLLSGDFSAVDELLQKDARREEARRAKLSPAQIKAAAKYESAVAGFHARQEFGKFRSSRVRIAGGSWEEHRIAMIRAIRTTTGLRLVDAKSLVDFLLAGESVTVSARDVAAAWLLIVEVEDLGGSAEVIAESTHP